MKGQINSGKLEYYCFSRVPHLVALQYAAPNFSGAEWAHQDWGGRVIWSVNIYRPKKDQPGAGSNLIRPKKEKSLDSLSFPLSPRLGPSLYSGPAMMQPTSTETL